MKSVGPAGGVGGDCYSWLEYLVLMSVTKGEQERLKAGNRSSF